MSTERTVRREASERARAPSPPPSSVGSRAAQYYGKAGAAYGSRQHDGWFFSRVRGREQRLTLSLLDARPGDEVLDAGCGAGALAEVLKGQGARVWGVDLSPELLSAAAPFLERAILSDLAALDLARTFDRILCSGSLEFTDDPRQALGVLARHASRGAVVVLLVPCGPFVWLYELVRRSRGLRGHTFRREELERWGREHGLQLESTARPSPSSLVVRLRKE